MALSGFKNKKMKNRSLKEIIIQRINDFDCGYSAAFKVIYTLVSEENISKEELINILKNYKNIKGHRHEEGENSFIKHKTSG